MTAMKSIVFLLSLALLTVAYPGPGCNEHRSWSTHKFTSTYSVVARPEQVVDNENNPTGGLRGAAGHFQFGINVHENTICYKIILDNFRGDYQSPARTATHIHEASAGKSGPPRIAFPNPEGQSRRRVSSGCLNGPFLTGVIANGQDTGAGFHVRQIEQNPGAFFTDVHSSEAVPGAVRGQLG